MNAFFYRFLILISSTMLLPAALWAQGSVQDTRIEVIKKREIKLKPLSKGFDQIPNLKPINQGQTLTYELKILPAQSVPTEIIAEAPKAPTEEKNRDLWETKPLKVFLKAGYGNYQTSLFEAQIQHQLDETLSYGIYAQHRASQKGEVADKFSALSRNVFGAYGKYFLDQSVIYADVEYSKRVNRFYGYDPTQLETFDADTLRQRYNRIAANIRYQSIVKNTALDYDFGLMLVSLQDNFGATEAQIGADMKASYALSDASRLGVSLEGFFTQREDTDKINRNYIKFTPKYAYQSEKFGFTVGANLIYQDDTLSAQNNYHIYPMLRADYLVSGQLQTYLDFSGTMQRNTLDGFVQQNPFLAPQALLYNTNQRWKAELGVEGTLLDRLTYQLHGSIGSFENLAFFVNTAADSAKFGIVYEPEASNVINVGLKLGYEFSEQYSLQLNTDFFNYDTKTLTNAWHRPTFTSNLVGIFKPIEGLSLQADLAIQAGIRAKNFSTDTQIDLNTITDLSLQADYLVFQNFSAYLSANNLFSKAYQRYLYYPNQGINFLIGLKYAF